MPAAGNVLAFVFSGWKDLRRRKGNCILIQLQETFLKTEPRPWIPIIRTISDLFQASFFLVRAAWKHKAKKHSKKFKAGNHRSTPSKQILIISSKWTTSCSIHSSIPFPTSLYCATRAQKEIFTRKTLIRIYYWDGKKKNLIGRIHLINMITLPGYTIHRDLNFIFSNSETICWFHYRLLIADSW